MKDKFAIIKLAGSQHLVREGDILDVNRLETEKDKSFDINDVLLVQSGDDIQIGTPLLEKSVVKAKVIDHLRGEKVTKSTFKSKSRYRRKVGHRQELTKIEITKIT